VNRVILYRDVAGERVEVCSVEYDPETTLSAEALESTGIPEVVALAQQSYRCDGEGWVFTNDGGLACCGFVAYVETIGLRIPIALRQLSLPFGQELGL
jgi:hypothetical protein